MECPKCKNCGRLMKWEAYTLAKRPDAMRKKDDRAPIDWAWHCWCGKWVYSERRWVS